MLSNDRLLALRESARTEADTGLLTHINPDISADRLWCYWYVSQEIRMEDIDHIHDQGALGRPASKAGADSITVLQPSRCVEGERFAQSSK